jgi:hypothetical protein
MLVKLILIARNVTGDYHPRDIMVHRKHQHARMAFARWQTLQQMFNANVVIHRQCLENRLELKQFFSMLRLRFDNRGFKELFQLIPVPQHSKIYLCTPRHHGSTIRSKTTDY